MAIEGLQRLAGVLPRDRRVGFVPTLLPRWVVVGDFEASSSGVLAKIRRNELHGHGIPFGRDGEDW